MNGKIFSLIACNNVKNLLNYVETLFPNGENLLNYVETLFPNGENLLNHVETFFPNGENLLNHVETFFPNVAAPVIRNSQFVIHDVTNF